MWWSVHLHHGKSPDRWSSSSNYSRGWMSQSSRRAYDWKPRELPLHPRYHWVWAWGLWVIWCSCTELWTTLPIQWREATSGNVEVEQETCEEFLKPDLDNYAWAVKNSSITTQGQRSLTLDLYLQKHIDWVFFVINVNKTYSVWAFYRTFNYW